MKRLNQMLAVAAVAGAVLLSAGQVLAQGGGGGGGRRGQGGGGAGGGNFDPAQFQQRMLERYKEQLEFTSDDEWNAVKPMVEKVVTAQQEVRALGGGGGRGGRGGGGAGGPGGGATAGGGRGGFGTEDADLAALQQAVANNAPAEEIKAKLAKVRDTRKVKEATLAKDRENLRKVLNTKREAQAVLAGLLN